LIQNNRTLITLNLQMDYNIPFAERDLESLMKQIIKIDQGELELGIVLLKAGYVEEIISYNQIAIETYRSALKTEIIERYLREEYEHCINKKHLINPRLKRYYRQLTKNISNRFNG